MHPPEAGEKLYEELITEGEGITETGHDKIMVLNCENGLSLDEINTHIKDLAALAESCDAEGIREKLKAILPEYTPQSHESEFRAPDPQRSEARDQRSEDTSLCLLPPDP